jgi:hypothetical protein
MRVTTSLLTGQIVCPITCGISFSTIGFVQPVWGFSWPVFSSSTTNPMYAR